MGLNTSWSNRLIADLQQDFGLSLGAAQGFAGALAMESEGFNTMQERNPTVPGSRGGYGMAQWTGERRKAFERYAEKHGLPIDSYEAQYGYLKEELNGVGNHDGGIIRKLKAVTDPQEAQKLVTGSAASGTGFLRPGVIHPTARAAWTNDVVNNYVKLPPGELPSVGSKLDTTRIGPDLTRIAPEPAPRSAATIARTKAMLGGMELALEVPLPRNRPERDPTQMPAQSTPRSGKYEYAPNGEPRDPDTGFLMEKSDPRYAEAKGIKQAPTPRPLSERPQPKAVIQAMLPELAPPMNAGSNESAGKNRNAQREEQRDLPRTEQPKASPTQTSNVSLPALAQERKEQALVSAILAERGDDPLVLRAAQIERGLLNDAQAARDEILAREAQRVERKVPQSQIERNPKKPSTATTRVANGIAGTVALPPGVRPQVAIPQLPDVKSIKPTLPSGSDSKALGFTYANEGVKPKTGYTPKRSMDEIVTTVRDEILSTVPTKPSESKEKVSRPNRNPDKEKQGKKTATLPSIALPSVSISSQNDVTNPDPVTGKTKSQDNVFAQAAEAVTGLISASMGIDSGGKQKPAGYRRPENNNAGGVGGYNYRPATGYGSRGYTSIESDTHVYDRETGTWVEK